MVKTPQMRIKLPPPPKTGSLIYASRRITPMPQYALSSSMASHLLEFVKKPSTQYSENPVDFHHGHRDHQHPPVMVVKSGDSPPRSAKRPLITSIPPW